MKKRAEKEARRGWRGKDWSAAAGWACSWRNQRVVWCGMQSRRDFPACAGVRQTRARGSAASGRKRVRTHACGCRETAATEERSGTTHDQIKYWLGTSAQLHPDAGRTERWRGKLQRGAGGVLVHRRPTDKSGRRPCCGKDK